jgi:hypothetical protein
MNVKQMSIARQSMEVFASDGGDAQKYAKNGIRKALAIARLISFSVFSVEKLVESCLLFFMAVGNASLQQPQRCFYRVPMAVKSMLKYVSAMTQIIPFELIFMGVW